MASGRGMIDRGASRPEASAATDRETTDRAATDREAIAPIEARSGTAADRRAVARTLGADRIARAEEARHVEIATGRERAKRTIPPGRWMD